MNVVSFLSPELVDPTRNSGAVMIFICLTSWRVRCVRKLLNFLGRQPRYLTEVSHAFGRSLGVFYKRSHIYLVRDSVQGCAVQYEAWYQFMKLSPRVSFE